MSGQKNICSAEVIAAGMDAGIAPIQKGGQNTQANELPESPVVHSM